MKIKKNVEMLSEKEEDFEINPISLFVYSLYFKWPTSFEKYKKKWEDKEIKKINVYMLIVVGKGKLSLLFICQ